MGPQSLVLSICHGILLPMHLPLGTKSEPGYFQEVVEQLTSDLP